MFSDPPQYTVQDGIIEHGTKIYTGDATNTRLTLLETFHQFALGAHSGITYQRIKQIFCWPHLKKMVETDVLCVN